MSDIRRKLEKLDWLILVLVWSICIVGLIVFSTNDMNLAMNLSTYSDRSLVNFFDESIFDGGAIGVSDFPIFVILGIIILGLVSLFIPRLPSRYALFAKYCTVSNLIFGVFVIHGLKFVIARARPYIAMNDYDKFSAFWEFGRFIPFLDRYSGSLPSGHTAATMSLLAVVYCYTAGSSSGKALVLRAILQSSVFILSLSMAISRVMAKDHFISDSLVSIMLAWLFHYVCFHNIFRIPMRVSYEFSDLGAKKAFGLSLVILCFLSILYGVRFLSI